MIQAKKTYQTLTKTFALLLLFSRLPAGVEKLVCIFVFFTRVFTFFSLPSVFSKFAFCALEKDFAVTKENDSSD